ncbi:MAG: hypothetical protein F6K11_11750, partial [Leptolyngbya sp. SIO3F4]|nr:hypothetical protein [Leptolyngbya sp. SIO3F4]
MSHSTNHQHNIFRITHWRDILILAIIYFLTAKFCQLLAIPPGNVTPVWIPSGIILAVILKRGYYIWPGIFLGAFIGNISAYLTNDSIMSIARAVVSGTANGIGDSLCAIVGAYLIVKTAKTTFPFTQVKHVISFILYGAVLGSFISAVLGVTG